MFYKKSLFLLPIIFFTFIFVILLFRSENSFELLSNESENIELAIYINDEETNIIPGKDSGYYYDREKSSCTNGAYINWDSISWSPVVQNMNGTVMQIKNGRMQSY